MIGNLRLGLFVFIFSACIHPLYAQEVVAHISADTNKILIGKPVNVVLQLSQPRSLSIDWPLFTDSMGQLEILQISPLDTVNIDDENILLRSQTITVTSFDSGAFFIPEVVFNYKLAGSDKIMSASTDPLRIEAFTVPVDTTAEIRDIRPVEKAPFDPMLLIWIILIYHAVLLLLGLIVWYLRKKAKESGEVSPGVSPLIPAHITALEELAVLEADQIWQQGFQKAYHTRLTDILRQYIENRWGVGAIELTTDEIISSNFTLTLEKQNVSDLERILRLADLVKFAKLTPGPGENDNVLKLAVKFVKDTAMADLVQTEQKTEL